jgi:hypothetical protein
MLSDVITKLLMGWKMSSVYTISGGNGLKEDIYIIDVANELNPATDPGYRSRIPGSILCYQIL